MKILFSDYDGTIKTFIKKPNIMESRTLNLNIKAINEFIEKGNKFIITTGRGTESILSSASRNKVKYNYITTYDGRVTLSNEGEIIYAKYLNAEAYNIVKKYNLGIVNGIYGAKGEAKNENELIYLIVKTNENITKKIEELKIIYSDIEFTYYKLLRRLILAHPFDKKMGIEELIKTLNLDGEIYTVGDGKNDKTMLEAYNGYKMLLSYPSLYSANAKTTSSLHSLIKKIN